ncbi:hypothetical protein PCYB_083400 [Plasmodium cynomolgi strain B]|uniref:Uncharacterized protein n=1 Tax=Plasmodium cynomolgi (strain B) TaxID=1120755 RepID=K6USI8_PLACD|nr:hypothetical protein PCYB_083400 [Plasmodium cynomolgi strain B]GAB66179.1 hypothetical protein PCYB_083400 [Plasmodium cynomolgi strain B]
MKARDPSLKSQIEKESIALFKKNLLKESYSWFKDTDYFEKLKSENKYSNAENEHETKNVVTGRVQLGWGGTFFLLCCVVVICDNSGWQSCNHYNNSIFYSPEALTVVYSILFIVYAFPLFILHQCLGLLSQGNYVKSCRMLSSHMGVLSIFSLFGTVTFCAKEICNFSVELLQNVLRIVNMKNGEKKYAMTKVFIDLTKRHITDCSQMPGTVYWEAINQCISFNKNVVVNFYENLWFIGNKENYIYIILIATKKLYEEVVQIFEEIGIVKLTIFLYGTIARSSSIFILSTFASYFHTNTNILRITMYTFAFYILNMYFYLKNEAHEYYLYNNNDLFTVKEFNFMKCNTYVNLLQGVAPDQGRQGGRGAGLLGPFNILMEKGKRGEDVHQERHNQECSLYLSRKSSLLPEKGDYFQEHSALSNLQKGGEAQEELPPYKCFDGEPGDFNFGGSSFEDGIIGVADLAREDFQRKMPNRRRRQSSTSAHRNGSSNKYADSDPPSWGARRDLFSDSSGPSAGSSEAIEGGGARWSGEGNSGNGGSMKGNSMKGGSMKGGSMKGGSMKGGSMKGGSMKGNSMKGNSMKDSSAKGSTGTGGPKRKSDHHTGIAARVERMKNMVINKYGTFLLFTVIYIFTILHVIDFRRNNDIVSEIILNSFYRGFLIFICAVQVIYASWVFGMKLQMAQCGVFSCLLNFFSWVVVLPVLFIVYLGEGSWLQMLIIGLSLNVAAVATSFVEVTLKLRRGASSTKGGLAVKLAANTAMNSAANSAAKLAANSAVEEQNGAAHHTENYQHYSYPAVFKKCLYWLYIGNLEVLRRNMNIAMSGNDEKYIPLFWSFFLKYINSSMLIVVVIYNTREYFFNMLPMFGGSFSFQIELGSIVLIFLGSFAVLANNLRKDHYRPQGIIIPSVPMFCQDKRRYIFAS